MLKFVLPYNRSLRWNMCAYIWTLYCRNVWLFNYQFDLFLKIYLFPKKYILIREGIFFLHLLHSLVKHILQTEVSRVRKALTSAVIPTRLFRDV